MARLRRELIAEIEALGWEVIGTTGGGHTRLRRRSDGKLYSTGATPSDNRHRVKLLCDLRHMNRAAEAATT